MMIFECEIEGDKIGNKVVMGCDGEMWFAYEISVIAYVVNCYRMSVPRGVI